MARYLLSDAPVKFWTPQGLVDGYMYTHGVWKDTQGYFCAASTGWNGKSGIGVLQWDGTFCPLDDGKDYRKFSFSSDKLTVARDEIIASNPFWAFWLTWGLWDKYLLYKKSAIHSAWVDDYDGTRYDTFFAHGMEHVIRVGGTSVLMVTPSGDIVLKSRLRAYSNGDVICNVGLDPLPPGEPVASYKGDDQYYFIYSNGQIVLYDHIAREVVSNTMWVDDLSSYWLTETTYCPLYNIFVTILREFIGGETVRQWDNYLTRWVDRPTSIRVYANEGVPFSMSVITIDPDPAETGRLSSVSVTVYGANGDTVEGLLVNWTLVSGGGSLVVTQSATDEYGVAYNEYVPPLIPETVEIKAEAVY